MTEAQLQAIAEHLRKHGWDATITGTANMYAKLNADILWVERVNCYWWSRIQTPQTYTTTRRAAQSGVDAFNAIAAAAGVPRLEVA
jgi:hypothetical protein